MGNSVTTFVVAITLVVAPFTANGIITTKFANGIITTISNGGQYSYYPQVSDPGQISFPTLRHLRAPGAHFKRRLGHAYGYGRYDSAYGVGQLAKRRMKWSN
eukprot:111436_1